MRHDLLILALETMHEHSVTMGKHTATKSNLNAAIVLLVTLVLI